MNTKIIIGIIVVGLLGIGGWYFLYNQGQQGTVPQPQEETTTDVTTQDTSESNNKTINQLCEVVSSNNSGYVPLSALFQCTDDEQNVMYALTTDLQGFEYVTTDYYDVEGNLVGSIEYTQASTNENCEYKGKKCSEYYCQENIC